MMRLLTAIAMGFLLPALPVAAQESPASPPATEQAERAAATPQADVSKPAAATQSKPATGTQSTSAQQGKFKTVDRMELDATAITGNRELPKVLYIVPWKKADLGDLVGRPANSLLDEVLAPVDREVFRRQTEYFDKLNTDAASAAAQSAPAAPPN